MMKKLFYIYFAIIMALASSCNKEKQPDNGSESNYGVDGKSPLPEAIDIGTVVNGKKVFWASFNLGANKIWEYGDYYSWGEILSKLDYSWATYIYANQAEDKLTKYCPKDRIDYWDGTSSSPDGIQTLYPTDDVAHSKLGGTWRIPTLEEFEALLALKSSKDHTWERWAYVTNANGDEVKDVKGNVIHGIRITRKSTGATLFIPAAGFCLGEAIENEGSRGLYWSSSLNPKNPHTAYALEFDSEESYYLHGFRRNRGFTIRPVSE